MEIEQKILERFQSMPCSIVSKIKECEIEYDTDAVFKIELGKSDLTTWKQVFNFALLNVFYGIDALYSRIESRDKHLFDAGMISEQAMARTLYMIKELTDKLDAYGVEPS